MWPQENGAWQYKSGVQLTDVIEVQISDTSYYTFSFVHTDIQHNSAEYLHLLIEAMQLSFADTWWYCADPNKVEVPVEGLLSKDYATARRNLMSKDKYIDGRVFRINFMHYYIWVECGDFSVALVDKKWSLSWQLHLVRIYLANVSTRCPTLRSTRASSRNVGKISSYQVKLSRKRTFHHFISMFMLSYV